MTVELRDFPPVTETVEVPVTLSKTKLERQNTCPRSLYLDIKHHGGTGSIEMDRGIALHETIERAEKLMFEQSEPIMPGEVARDLAEAVMAERLDLVLPAAEQDRVRGMAWNWAESPQGRIDFDTILGTELSLEVELCGYRCTCRLDRAEAVGSTLHIYDWKSGFPGKQEDTDSSFQGQFYAMALLFGHKRDEPEQTFGAGVNDVFFYETFPRIRDEESGSLFVREASWSRTEIAEFKASIERNLMALEHSFETGDWPARDGSWCSRCPAPSECPIPMHLRNQPEIETEQDAKDALAWLSAYDRLKKPFQDGLREWVKQNGKVIRGDYVFDASPSDSTSVKDMPGLEAEVARATLAGQPIDETPFIERRVSTRYSKRKIRKEEMESK